jgi:Domain of unknown function (DUF222)
MIREVVGRTHRSAPKLSQALDSVRFMSRSIEQLLALDPSRLSHDERIDLLEQLERARSVLDSRSQLTLAALAREGDAEFRSKQWVREEVAGVLSIAPQSAGSRLHDAVALTTRLPKTFARLAAGEIGFWHAKVLIEAVEQLDDETVGKLESKVTDKASQQSIGEFRQTVKRAVLRLDPDRAEEKHRAAYEQRRVSMRADEHGMAGVFAYLRADQAMALMTSLSAHAAMLPSDGRTADQRRADVLADYTSASLTAAKGTWQGRRPAVQVSVALSTLLGLDEQPGELAGYGPIPASLARAIAHDPSGTWRRLVTDPLGRLIRCGTETYRPPAALRDHVIAEHGTCTFFGCRRQACRGELDHVIPWPNWPGTVAENLHTTCKRHHDLKHQTEWRVLKRADGVIWIAPTRRQYFKPVHAYPVDHTGRGGADPPPF